MKGIWKIFKLLKENTKIFITYVTKHCWHYCRANFSAVGRTSLLLHKHYFQLCCVLRGFFSCSYLHKICEILLLKISILRENSQGKKYSWVYGNTKCDPVSWQVLQINHSLGFARLLCKRGHSVWKMHLNHNKTESNLHSRWGGWFPDTGGNILLHSIQFPSCIFPLAVGVITYLYGEV